MQMHDVVRIIDLKKPDDEYNGTLALCISDPFTHPIVYKQVVKIKIRDILWSIETCNVEVVNEADKVHFIRNLDGNQIVPWDQCFWQPKDRRTNGT